MNNDEEFVRLWTEIMNSLANSEAPPSDVRRINSEGGGENVSRKRPTESRREGKRERVKRQCVSKSSDKSHDNLLEKEIRRERLRTKLEELKEITPNCPKSDIIATLDHVIEYTTSLRLSIFFIALHEYTRNM